MKNGPKKKTPLALRATKKKAAQPVRRRELVTIDNAPVRAAAMEGYRELEAQLSGLQANLEAFEKADLPAYQRWEARALGPLLSELRQVSAELEEKRALLIDIEDECFWSGCTPVAGYRRVMASRERAEHGEEDVPPGEDDPDEGAERADRGAPRVFGDSDLPPGVTPESYGRMSAREKRDFHEFFGMMSELYEAMTGEHAPSLEEALRGAKETGPRPRADEAPRRERPASARKPAATPETDRIKELYRRLVRELHPDVRGEQTAREREIWHQVQDAYRTGDLEKLEALSARLEAGLHGVSDQLPLGILQRMARQLQEGLLGLRRQLGQVQRHPAWKFAGKKTNELAKLEGKHRRRLEDNLHAAKAQLSTIRHELERLAAQAARPPQARRKKGRSSAGAAFGQADFQF